MALPLIPLGIAAGSALIGGTAGYFSADRNKNKRNGSFWKGADGNVYVQGANGINRAGRWDSNTENYWSSRGFYRTPDSQTNHTPNAGPGGDTIGGFPGVIGGDGGAAARAAAEDRRNRDFTIGNIDNQIAAYERQFGDLDAQERAGLNALQDAYNRGMGRLNEQHGAALSKYKTQRGDNKRNFMNSADDNRASARTNYQALMQMLGRAGAGRSSAAQNLVPYAVSQTASKQHGALSDDYALNDRNINVAEEDTTRSYNWNKEDLGKQRRDNRHHAVA